MAPENFFTLLLPINKWSCVLHLDFECLVESFLVENYFLISQLIHAAVLHLNLPNKRTFSSILPNEMRDTSNLNSISLLKQY